MNTRERAWKRYIVRLIDAASKRALKQGGIRR